MFSSTKREKKSIAIIPARYASSRLPGKMLMDIAGKSLIQRVWEQLQKCQRLSACYVATDDNRILEHIESFDGLGGMTDSAHKSGTDRCLELASKFSGYDLLINVQGDEPFISPQAVDLLIEKMLASTYTIGTLKTEITEFEEVADPSVVKLVSAGDRACYFSRSPIPFNRDGVDVRYEKHIGIYAFQWKILTQLAQLEEGRLEAIEKLEQLRWLENGIDIGVWSSPWNSLGVDTMADIKKATAYALASEM